MKGIGGAIRLMMPGERSVEKKMPASHQGNKTN